MSVKAPDLEEHAGAVGWQLQPGTGFGSYPPAKSIDLGTREPVDPFVPRVPGMSLDPMPVDAVAAIQHFEPPPQVHVLHRTAVSSSPTLRTPARQPGRNPLPQVLGIRVQLDQARASEMAERGDGRHELHPVVRSARSATGELLDSAVTAQDDRRPTAGARIRARTAVRIDDATIAESRFPPHAE